MSNIIFKQTITGYIYRFFSEKSRYLNENSYKMPSRRVFLAVNNESKTYNLDKTKFALIRSAVQRAA